MNQRGAGMIEVLIAVAIMGFAGIAILGALTTGLKAQDLNREGVVSENLARNALEEIRGSDPQYQGTYTLTLTPPQGYSVIVATTTVCPDTPPVYEDRWDPIKEVWKQVEIVTLVTDCAEDNLQLNAVTVYRGGKPVVLVTDLKARR